jgi:mono/diheme cytochrome c family protein
MRSDRLLCLALATLSLATAPGCAGKQPEVSYKNDVAPILAANCASCHVPGQPGYIASGFDLGGYDSLMKGTRFGPVVIPGDPLTSALVMLIEGRADPSLKMPHGDAKPLTKDEIKTIRRWVKQGAKNN